MLWKTYVASVDDSFCFPDWEFNLPDPMLDYLNNVERAHWSLHRPTDLLMRLIREIWYEVHDYPELWWHNSWITIPNRRAIWISTEINNERRRFTLWHELGHAIIFESWISGLSDEQIEDVCDEFSARLLVSDCGLRFKILKSRWGIESIATYFEVSKECMRLCLASRMGLIS